MITVRTIAQQVLDRLKKFSSDSDVTENDLILAASQMFAFTVQQKHLEGKKRTGVRTPDGMYYFVFKDIPVTGEDPKEFELPATPTSMENGEGIRVYKKIGAEEYTPVPSSFASMTNSLISGLGGTLGYYIKGTTGYFLPSPAGLEPPSSVVVEMLTPIMDANPDAYITITADLQQLIVDRLFERFAASDQIKSDETKDDVDQPV